uniref:F-box protein AT5G49610-like beta-propeller domain-containing protein n=1 Tax=Aegilops tauschii TaxID=37682 RepID=M8C8N0_AEGTA
MAASVAPFLCWEHCVWRQVPRRSPPRRRGAPRVAITGDIELPSTLGPENFVGRANGTIYWGIEGSDTDVLVLDESTAEFSTATLPEALWWPSHKGISRVVGGEDGVLRVIRLINNELKVFARRRPDSDDDDEWSLEMQLRLPEATLGLPGREESFFQQEAMIVSANTRYVLLTPSEETWLFSVELDTMRVERNHERNKYAGAAHPYKLPWPPALADPSRERGQD